MTTLDRVGSGWRHMDVPHGSQGPKYLDHLPLIFWGPFAGSWIEDKLARTCIAHSHSAWQAAAKFIVHNAGPCFEAFLKYVLQWTKHFIAWYFLSGTELINDSLLNDFFPQVFYFPNAKILVSLSPRLQQAATFKNKVNNHVMFTKIVYEPKALKALGLISF